MPTGNENDKSLEAIDWDEFHPTSPVQRYILSARHCGRNGLSVLGLLLLIFVGQFSVSLFLTPLLFVRA